MNNIKLICFDLDGTLNVSGLIGLISLDCSDNLLSSLDISNCVNLNYLNCQNNSLTLLSVDAIILSLLGGTPMPSISISSGL